MKKKLFVIIITIILCFGATVFGVYAAYSGTLNTNGSVSFNAEGLDVDIEAVIVGAVGTGITTSYVGTTNKTRQPDKNLISNTPWNFGRIKFDEKNALSLNDFIITFEFKISNFSNFAIEADIHVPFINGLSITKHDMNYIYGYESEMGADVQLVTVTINPTAVESPVNLNNLNIMININKTLKKETDLTKFKWGMPVGGKISIIGNNLSSSDTEIIIPKKNGNNIVNFVESSAFANCTSLVHISIPGGVNSIGNSAFSNCSSLNSIYLPNSVIIGYAAFLSCSSLTNVNIGGNDSSIGSSAFSNCTSLKSLTLQNGVKSIGEQAFFGCSSLTVVFIPASLTSIGNNAFTLCSSLTSINVEAENVVFSSDSNKVLYNKDKTKLILCPAAKINFIIPNSVISIGSAAFRECSNLTNIIIPNSINEIGDAAFYYCSSLLNVYFERTSVFTTLGNSSFFYLAVGSTLIFKNQAVMNQFTTSHYTSASTSKIMY